MPYGRGCGGGEISEGKVPATSHGHMPQYPPLSLWTFRILTAAHSGVSGSPPACLLSGGGGSGQGCSGSPWSNVTASQEVERPVLTAVGCLELVPQTELPLVLQLQSDDGLPQGAAVLADHTQRGTYARGQRVTDQWTNKREGAPRPLGKSASVDPSSIQTQRDVLPALGQAPLNRYVSACGA